MQTVRSILFFIIFLAVTIIHSVLSLLVAPFISGQKRFRFVRLLNYFVIWWFGVCCGVRYRIEGLEHLANIESGILMSNHQSEWETFYLQTLVSPLCTVLKKELLRIPFFGWALALIKPIAIDRQLRSSALKQIVEQGTRKLQDGFWVLIFPEGTRVEPGRHKKFSKTAALLAVETGKPIIPIAHNAGKCWPGKGFLKRSGVLQVIVGPPIYPQGKGIDELYVQSRDWVESNRDRLTAQSQPVGR